MPIANLSGRIGELFMPLEVGELREYLLSNGVPVAGRAFPEHMVDAYEAAALKYLWSAIDQTVVLDTAAELPEGRPDYRAVTRSNRLRSKKISNALRFHVEARPAFWTVGGQVSLLTQAGIRRNKVTPTLPGRFSASRRVLGRRARLPAP